MRNIKKAIIFPAIFCVAVLTSIIAVSTINSAYRSQSSNSFSTKAIASDEVLLSKNAVDYSKELENFLQVDDISSEYQYAGELHVKNDSDNHVEIYSDYKNANDTIDPKVYNYKIRVYEEFDDGTRSSTPVLEKVLGELGDSTPYFDKLTPGGNTKYIFEVKADVDAEIDEEFDINLLIRGKSKGRSSKF